MLRLIDRRTIEKYPELVRSMHRDRKRLFVDIFRWELSHENGEERDAFDMLESERLPSSPFGQPGKMVSQYLSLSCHMLKG